jgi:hypothetical protein
MNLAFIEKIVLSYLEAHPEILQQLVERLVKLLLDRLSENLKNQS